MRVVPILFIVFPFLVNAQGGREVVSRMLDRYHNGPCPCYTFSQKNTHYVADSVTGHSEWHEAVCFPDRFSIVFGNDGKNKVVFRNDSMYRYRRDALVSSRRDTNSLLLLLGGMFYRPQAEVFQRLAKHGFDVDKVATEKLKGREMYVIGNAGGNRFWVDKELLRVERIMETGKDEMDIRFDAHQPWCKGFVETHVSFWRNGRLEQVEEYYDIREANGF